MTMYSFTADFARGQTFTRTVHSIIADAVARLGHSLAVRRQARTVRNELLEYAPHELAELGISQADVDVVAEDAVRRQLTMTF